MNHEDFELASQIKSAIADLDKQKSEAAERYKASIEAIERSRRIFQQKCKHWFCCSRATAKSECYCKICGEES